MNRFREASLPADHIEVHKKMFLRRALNENGLHLLQNIEEKGWTNRRFWTFMRQSTVPSHWLSKSW